MSHYMTALAMKQKGLKPAAKIVLYWLADHHNGETGQCNPSIKRLAECCETSRRSVENHIASLEAAGVIKVDRCFREKGGKSTNNYTFLMAESDAQNLRMGSAKSAHGVCAKSAHDRTLEDTNLGKEPIARDRASGSDEPVLFSEMEQPENKSDTVDLFDQFWEVYPKKKNKGAARKRWKQAIKKTKPETIIAGAKGYASYLKSGGPGDWRPNPKYPDGWLNNESWEDYLNAEPEASDRPARRNEDWMERVT